MKYTYFILSCLLLLKSHLHGAVGFRYAFATPPVPITRNNVTENQTVTPKNTTITTTERTNITTTFKFKTNRINASGIIRMVRNENLDIFPKVTRGLHLIDESNYDRSDAKDMLRTKKDEIDVILDKMFEKLVRVNVNEKGEDWLETQDFRNTVGKFLDKISDDNNEMDKNTREMEENTRETDENTREMRENTREFDENDSKIDFEGFDEIKIYSSSEENRKSSRYAPYRNKHKKSKFRYKNKNMNDNQKINLINKIRQKLKITTQNGKRTGKRPIRIRENSDEMGGRPNYKSRTRFTKRGKKKSREPKEVIKIELNDNIDKLQRYLQGRNDLEYDIDPGEEERDRLNFNV